MKEKKKYIKPSLKKNEPLANITFATAAATTGTSIPGTGGGAAPTVG